METPQHRYRCPCCGYFTLESRAAYAICPVCFWEDDDADEESGQAAPERPELGVGQVWPPRRRGLAPVSHAVRAVAVVAPGNLANPVGGLARHGGHSGCCRVAR